MKSKIRNKDGARRFADQLRRRGKKVVFTNGCFDIIHYGHVKYLQDARKKGDALIVGLNSDRSVRRIKGDKRPLVCQADRSRIIAALESVDCVVIFNQATPLELIKAVKPDILVKGGDWKLKDIVGSDFVCGYGGKVAAIKFIKGRSTTKLIKKIAETY